MNCLMMSLMMMSCYCCFWWCQLRCMVGNLQLLGCSRFLRRLECSRQSDLSCFLIPGWFLHMGLIHGYMELGLIHGYMELGLIHGYMGLMSLMSLSLMI